MNPKFIEIVIELNRKGLSVFPLSRLGAVCVYTADYYENYDYDIVLPSQREKLVKILTKQGFKQTTGRIISHQSQSLAFEFPKPNFTLGDDPAHKVAKLIEKSSNTIIITPTQALLIYCKQFYDEILQELESNAESTGILITELLDLVYEQPANLDKVREWLGPSNQTQVFILLKQQLRESQQKGIDDRQQFRFQSRIISRLQQV